MLGSIKPSACFLLGLTGKGYTVDEKALLGSVSDDPYDVRTFLRVIHNPTGLDHIGTELISTTEHTLSERGYFAKLGETTRGVNAAGLAFTCAMIIEDPEITPPKDLVAYSDITGKLMRTCQSVDDALELFKSFGAATPAYTVLLSDSKGDLAQLEIGGFGIDVIHHYSQRDPGYVLSVNCYQSNSLSEYNAPIALLTNEKNNNAARLNRGRVLVEQTKGSFTVQVLARVLSDHANKDRNPMDNPILEAWGYSICNHGTRSQMEYPYENLPWGTVSSEILEPAYRRFWYCYGWPCGEKPEYGDQIFQDGAWGKYLPFKISVDGKDEQGSLILTSVDGTITAEGVRRLDCS